MFFIVAPLIELLLEILSRFWGYFFVQLVVVPVFNRCKPWILANGTKIEHQIVRHVEDLHAIPSPIKCNAGGCHIIRPRASK